MRSSLSVVGPEVNGCGVRIHRPEASRSLLESKALDLQGDALF